MYTYVFGYEAWLEQSLIPLKAGITNHKVMSRYREATAITVEERARQELGMVSRRELMENNPKFLISINGYGCWVVDNLMNPASDMYNTYALKSSLTWRQSNFIVYDIFVKAGVMK